MHADDGFEGLIIIILYQIGALLSVLVNSLQFVRFQLHSGT